MAISRLERLAPWSGIAFVVLFIVGFSLLDFPSGDDPAEEIASFYNDSGNRAEVIIGSYLLVLSGLSFLWFLGSLRTRLLTSEGEPGRLTAIAFGGGLVFVALLMAAAAAFMSVAANITFGDEDFAGAEAARLLPNLGYPLLLIGGAFGAIATISATSLVAMRTGAFPRWLAWFGFVTAVVLLVAFMFFPLLLLLVWVAIVSVVIARTPPPPLVRTPSV